MNSIPKKPRRTSGDAELESEAWAAHEILGKVDSALGWAKIILADMKDNEYPMLEKRHGKEKNQELLLVQKGRIAALQELKKQLNDFYGASIKRHEHKWNRYNMGSEGDHQKWLMKSGG